MRIEGIDGLQRRLKAIADTRELLKEMQKETVVEAHARVPVKTGDLYRSIVPGTLTKDSARVIAAKSYAGFVERGTKPHRIEPRNAKVLAWPATAAGRRLSGRANARALSGSAGLGVAGGGFGGISIKRVGKTGKSSGTFRYARGVDHPGTRPMPYLMPGAKAAVAKVGGSFFVHAWDEAD